MPTTDHTAKRSLSELHAPAVVFEKLVGQLAEKPAKPITISDDGEKLFIPYPSLFGADESVFVEFGGRNVISPNEEPDRQLLEDVVKHKNIFLRASYLQRPHWRLG